MKAHWTTQHRGPFFFLVVRPSKGRTPVRTEWLKGQVSAGDVDDEADALLTDKRDTILRVHVWSDREEQFVHTYRKLVPQKAAA
jgi:hypothetical protein